jgi:hypothetical protein
MRIKTVFILLFLLHISGIFGQDIRKCKSTHYWVFGIESTDQFRSVSFTDSLMRSGERNIVIVNEFFLQCIEDAKGNYDAGETEDQKILVKYIMNFVRSQSESFKSKLDLHVEAAETGSTRKTLLWYYPMPAGANAEVEDQVFISTIIGKRIFTLSSPHFKSRSLAEVKEFLLTTMKTLKIVEKKFDEGTFCGGN